MSETHQNPSHEIHSDAYPEHDAPPPAPGTNDAQPNDSSASSQNDVLRTLKPSLRLALPTWVAYMALAMVITWTLREFHDLVMASAQALADLIGERFPRQTWYAWLLGLIWSGCLIKPLWKTLTLVTTQYEVTGTLLYYTRGVINRKRDQIELARIRDLSARRTLIERVLGVGSLEIDSADRTHPYLMVSGQPDVYDLKEWLHGLNISERSRLGYRELEGTQSIGN